MTRFRACIALLLALPLLAACDPEHKEKCEWYLVPEPAHIDLVPEGWVALCARNYVTKKQKCYLKSNIEFAKAVSGKTFRLSTLRENEKGPFPREVLGVKACGPSEEERARLEQHPLGQANDQEDFKQGDKPEDGE